MSDRARRFTWLVDILYDHRVKLLASAAGRRRRAVREGANSHEFARTVSRLTEMQHPRIHGTAAPCRTTAAAAA